MSRLFIAMALAASLTACTTAKILTIDRAPTGVSSASKVQSAVESALQARGWQITERKPGEIDANIAVRTHRAAVAVTYDAASYSIAYRDSENLDHNGDSIHRNYNRWVANLNTEIQAALAKGG